LMIEAEGKGLQGAQLEAIESQWIKQAGIKRFDEAVADKIKELGLGHNKVQEYLAAARGKSNLEARAIAKKIIGQDVFWDWDAARSREGNAQD